MGNVEKKAELMSAIRFGEEVIEDYKQNGRQVPAWVYERQIELYKKLLTEAER